MRLIFTLKQRDFTQVKVRLVNSTQGLKHLEALLEIDLAKHSSMFFAVVSAQKVLWE
jgi:hypothetical protein